MADLRQLSPQEFDSFIQGIAPNGSSVTTPPRDDLPPDVAPNTRQALLNATDALAVRIPDSLMSTGAKRMGMRPGVFLDTETGAPGFIRYQLGLDENKLNQFKLLNRFYGPGNVDISDDGRFVLRNQKTVSGNTEDVIVDPVGIDKGDAAQMESQIIPMVAGALGARYGGKLGSGGISKVIGAVTGMALGQEATGLGQDAFIRWLRDNDVNIGELAKHRAASAVADEVFGLMAAGGAKTISKIVEGAVGIPQIATGTTGAKEAAESLRYRTGVKFPLTPGQESENSLLLRLESMIGERMGTAGAIDKLRASQKTAEDELRRVFLGLPRTMSDEDLMVALPRADVVGQKGLTRLGSEALRLEGNVAKAAQEVQQTGTAEAQQLAGVNLSSPLDVTKVGGAARSKTVSDFDLFKSDMRKRYTDFLSKPEITSRTINGQKLATDVANIEDEFIAKATKAKEIPSYDAYGSPTSKTVTSEERLDSSASSKVLKFIDDLKSLGSANVSIRDLKNTKTAINNAIAEGISIPGTDTAQLYALKDAVDAGIESGLKGMPDRSLLGTWKSLSDEYSKGISRFDKVGIREMLIKEGERGSVGNTQIAESITGNTPQALDRYNEFKEFFGASSPEFESLQAAARQKILFGSLNDLTGYVDGAALRSRLQDVRPEVAQELFGVNKNEISRIGEALSKAQGKLDVEELGRLAESNSLTAAKIPELVAAENERAVAYNNKLIKAAARGTVGAEKIKPSEFVRYASEMDPQDAAKVVGILSDQPELLHQIRQLQIEKILEKASAGSFGQERISADLLDKALGNELQQRTARILAGNDAIDNLKLLIQATTPREFAAGTFKGGGRLAGASDITSLALKGQVGELKSVAARFLLGFLYSGPLRRAVTNLATSSDSGRFLNGVIASTPFIENLIERYRPDGAFLIMNSLRDMIEPVQTKELAIQGKLNKTQFDPRSLSPEEFQQWLKNNTKQ